MGLKIGEGGSFLTTNRAPAVRGVGRIVYFKFLGMKYA